MFQKQVQRDYRSPAAVEAERAATPTPENAFRDLYLAAHAVVVDESDGAHGAALAKALNQSHAMLQQLGIEVPSPPVC